MRFAALDSRWPGAWPQGRSFRQHPAKGHDDILYVHKICPPRRDDAARPRIRHRVWQQRNERPWGREHDRELELLERVERVERHDLESHGDWTRLEFKPKLRQPFEHWLGHRLGELLGNQLRDPFEHRLLRELGQQLGQHVER